MRIVPYIPAKRTPNKFMGTNFGNELVDAFRSLGPVVTYGNADNPLNVRPLVSFKVTSVVTSQIGRYNAKVFQNDPKTETASGNLAEADLGTLASSDNAVVWHTPEIAGKGGTLSIDGIYQGRVAGVNSSGKLIILIGAAGGSTLKYGTATADWSSGNAITLTPCASASDDTATGESNVTCYIVSPPGASPANVNILADDIIAYVPFFEQDDNGKDGICVGVLFGNITLGNTEGQVYQMTSTTTAGWQFIEAT